MKISSKCSRRSSPGFTLIELLVVISIIAILAGLLLPAIAAVKQKALVNKAKTEMGNLAAAIAQYESTYGRYPGKASTLPNNTIEDTTYGVPATIMSSPMIVPTNSDIVVTVMDYDGGVNASHAKNPGHHTFFSPAKTVTETNASGFSTTDLQLHDPWGNPYGISIDLNSDGYTRDAVYSSQAVTEPLPPATDLSKGLNGLVDINNNKIYLLKGPVMIWSWGPDKKASSGGKASKQATGDLSNKDNILSWQQ